jgi:hypothetical protein
MAKDFNFSDQTIKHVHGHAMHYFEQYLCIYSAENTSIFPDPQIIKLLPAFQTMYQLNN